MSSIFTLSASDLASLLCSKVCHDIISPVGAINNGLELLEEGGADEAAMDLIKTSARNASARLQFARIAFGAAGSAGVQIDTGDAQAVATEYMRGEKAEFTWNGDRAYLPKNKVKLLLNLILIANGSIPRGGTLDVGVEARDDATEVVVRAAGTKIAFDAQIGEALAGKLDPAELTGRTAPAHLLSLIAAQCGGMIQTHAESGTLLLGATLPDTM